jgi:hypothetical protein
MFSYLEWEANNTFEDMDSPVELHNSSNIWNVVDENDLLAEDIAASETLLICLPKRSKTLKCVFLP